MPSFTSLQKDFENVELRAVLWVKKTTDLEAASSDLMKETLLLVGFIEDVMK